MKRLCIDCQRPTSRGRTGTMAINYLRCLVCETARTMRTWRYWRRATR